MPYVLDLGQVRERLRRAGCVHACVGTAPLASVGTSASTELLRGSRGAASRGSPPQRARPACVLRGAAERLVGRGCAVGGGAACPSAASSPLCGRIVPFGLAARHDGGSLGRVRSGEERMALREVRSSTTATRDGEHRASASLATVSICLPQKVSIGLPLMQLGRERWAAI